jgi:hypothetical protein
VHRRLEAQGWAFLDFGVTFGGIRVVAGAPSPAWGGSGTDWGGVPLAKASPAVAGRADWALAGKRRDCEIVWGRGEEEEPQARPFTGEAPVLREEHGHVFRTRSIG